MRNPRFGEQVAEWAALHDLHRTSRYPCGHGLIGRGLASEDHRRYCLGESARLIARGSLWRAETGSLLVAWPFGPTPNDLAHIVFWQEVQAYAARVGAVAFTPGSKNHLHRLYDDPDSTVVLFGVGLSQRTMRRMCMGIQRPWLPRPSNMFGEQSAKEDRTS